MSDHLNDWNFCKDCGTANDGFSCERCGSCVGNEQHCHDKKDGHCIPFIEDCETHWASCGDDCHSEHACQNP